MELSFMISETFIIYKSLGKYRKLQLQKLVKSEYFEWEKNQTIFFLIFLFSKYWFYKVITITTFLNKILEKKHNILLNAQHKSIMLPPPIFLQRISKP